MSLTRLLIFVVDGVAVLLPVLAALALARHRGRRIASRMTSSIDRCLREAGTVERWRISGRLSELLRRDEKRGDIPAAREHLRREVRELADELASDRTVPS